VVVDLGVGQVAALLAEDDQCLQPAFARFDIGSGQFARRNLDVPAVPALLVRGILGTLAGDPGGNFTDRGFAR
jgi:hypothetical protein